MASLFDKTPPQLANTASRSKEAPTTFEHKLLELVAQEVDGHLESPAQKYAEVSAALARRLQALQDTKALPDATAEPLDVELYDSDRTCVASESELRNAVDKIFAKKSAKLFRRRGDTLVSGLRDDENKSPPIAGQKTDHSDAHFDETNVSEHTTPGVPENESPRYPSHPRLSFLKGQGKPSLHQGGGLDPTLLAGRHAHAPNSNDNLGIPEVPKEAVHPRDEIHDSASQSRDVRGNRDHEPSNACIMSGLTPIPVLLERGDSVFPPEPRSSTDRGPPRSSQSGERKLSPSRFQVRDLTENKVKDMDVAQPTSRSATEVGGRPCNTNAAPSRPEKRGSSTVRCDKECDEVVRVLEGHPLDSDAPEKTCARRRHEILDEDQETETEVTTQPKLPPDRCRTTPCEGCQWKEELSRVNKERSEERAESEKIILALRSQLETKVDATDRLQAEAAVKDMVTRALLEYTAVLKERIIEYEVTVARCGGGLAKEGAEHWRENKEVQSWLSSHVEDLEAKSVADSAFAKRRLLELEDKIKQLEESNKAVVAALAREKHKDEKIKDLEGRVSECHYRHQGVNLAFGSLYRQIGGEFDQTKVPRSRGMGGPGEAQAVFPVERQSKSESST